MQGSEQNAGHGDRHHGQVRDLLRRNREALGVGIFAGLVVVALTTAIGIIAGAGRVVAMIAAVAVVAFAAGALITRRAQRAIADSPASELPAAEPEPPDVDVLADAGRQKVVNDMAKLTGYFASYFTLCNQLDVGPLEDVEAALLRRPAQQLERWNRGSVHLAVFEPVEGKAGETCWHLPYAARMSRSECGEFEVPLKDSYLAQRQARWEPGEGVITAPDLQEEGWRKSSADSEAFAQGGFRMLRFFPFGPPSGGGQTRPCIVLLSKESEETATFGDPDDIYLRLLGTLLRLQALQAERARFLAEGGEASQ